MERKDVHEYFGATAFEVDTAQYGELYLVVVDNGGTELDKYVDGSYGGARKLLTVEANCGPEGDCIFSGELRQAKNDDTVTLDLSEQTDIDEYQSIEVEILGADLEDDYHFID